GNAPASRAGAAPVGFRSGLRDGSRESIPTRGFIRIDIGDVSWSLDRNCAIRGPGRPTSAGGGGSSRENRSPSTVLLPGLRGTVAGPRVGVEPEADEAPPTTTDRNLRSRHRGRGGPSRQARRWGHSELEVEDLVPPPEQPPRQGAAAAIDLGVAAQARL